MSEPRSYIDRPARRVSVSLLLAIAAHVAVLGVGYWFVKDYVNQPRFVPRGPLTQQELERTMRQLPVYSGLIETPSIVERSLSIETSPAWSDLRVVEARQAALPFAVAWDFDKSLTVRIDAKGAPR